MRKTVHIALLAAVAASALAAPALAQGLPPLPGPGGMPAGIPAPQLPVLQAQNIAGPQRPVQAKAPEFSGAAPMPAQPAGGFMAEPPRPDAADPAMRMNLDNARAQSARLQADGQSQLTNMTAKNFEQTPVAQLPNAQIQGEGDLQNLVKSQRNIRVLHQQVEEAKKAVELWHVLYNNEDAKQWREKEEKILEARRKEEEAAKEKERVAQQQQQQQQAMAAMAMGGGAGGPSASLVNGGGPLAAALASPPPVAPKVVEVSGSQALLLVPGKGEVWGRAGTSLTGGYRILSVAPKKVEVVGPKGREVLAFGTSLTAPVPMGGQRPPMGQAPSSPRL